jgi:hypothetical protein
MASLQGDEAPTQIKRTDGDTTSTNLIKTEKKSENASSRKSSGSVHPLRALQKKFGEVCFVCKGTDHVAKQCPTKPADRKKVNTLASLEVRL